MNVIEYLAAHKKDDLSLHALCLKIQVAYSTLHSHVKHGKPVSVDTAKKLETWSKGPDAPGEPYMKAADILGLDPDVEAPIGVAKAGAAPEDADLPDTEPAKKRGARAGAAGRG